MKAKVRNKLIVKFMIHDGEIHYPNGDWERPTVIEGYNFIHPLYYHSSWDWLMPVVGRCMEHGEIMQHTPEQQFIMQSFAFLDISKTYEAVIEFINWYNETKLSKYN